MNRYSVVFACLMAPFLHAPHEIICVTISVSDSSIVTCVQWTGTIFCSIGNVPQMDLSCNVILSKKLTPRLWTVPSQTQTGQPLIFRTGRIMCWVPISSFVTNLNFGNLKGLIKQYKWDIKYAAFINFWPTHCSLGTLPGAVRFWWVWTWFRHCTSAPLEIHLRHPYFKLSFPVISSTLMAYAVPLSTIASCTTLCAILAWGISREFTCLPPSLTYTARL